MNDYKKTFDELIAQAQQGAQIVVPGQPSPTDAIGMLVGAVQELQATTRQLMHTSHTIGANIDIARLAATMTLRILVEKGLITEEELQAKYKTEVADVYEKVQEQMRKQYEEMMASEEKASAPEQSDSEVVAEVTSCESVELTEEVASDLVLPSERADSKVVFKEGGGVKTQDQE